MTIQLKRNDTKDTISYVMTYANGTVVNLTGASVRFLMGKGNTLVTSAAATIVNAANGQVEYTLTEQDTVLDGVFNAEFEVTFSDNKVKTFPSNGYIKVHIQANIDSDKTAYMADQIAMRVSDVELFKTEINEKVAITQQLIDGSFDDGLLKTNIQTKLTNLETQYAPRLNTVESSLAQNETKTNLAMDNRLNTSARGGISTVKMIAHRGFSVYAPENTIPAYYEAAKAGFYGAECDVQLTSDGKWVVIHDSSVDRTTNGTGNVNSLTLTQIKALDAGSWKHAYYTGTRIPTLQEFLKVCRRTGLVPYIEMKNVETAENTANLISEVKKYFDSKDFVIIAAAEINLRNIRSLDKDITLGLVQPITDSFTNTVKELGNAFMNCPYAEVLDPVKVQMVRDKKIEVDVWTVNSYQTCLSLAEIGVNGITTDSIPFMKGV